MRRARGVTAWIGLIIGCAYSLAWGADDSTGTHEAPAPVIQAEAIDALAKMGEYLRTLKTFSVTCDITIDEVLLSGQKIQVSGANTLTVRRPDRLKATMKQDETDIDAEFYYDGKTFTAY